MLCNEQLKTFASDTIFAAKKGGDNAGSVYVAQPPFYEASLPDSKPLSKPDLQNYGEIWLEPISHDTELREQLRGTYRVYEHWVENNFGNRFSLDTYGVKWLAFSNK